MGIYNDIDYRLNTINKDIKISEDSAAINNSIRNILLTQKYTVPGNPEFGADLDQVLFEQMDGVTFALIENIVRTEIERWEPRILIENIDIFYNKDYQQVVIKLRYIIIASNEIQETNIKLGV